MQHFLQAIPIILILLFFVMVYIFFAYIFKRNRKDKGSEESLPASQGYARCRGQLLECIRQIKEAPCLELYCTSMDGLRLFGRYYENRKGAPLMLMFHGYRGYARRDAAGFYQICKEAGWNLLVVDQRSHGESEGEVITFGIKERMDVLTWTEYMTEYLGPDVKMVLSGVSMGAATVLMASNLKLPDQVKGIAADCGYTEPKEAIRQNARHHHCPGGLAVVMGRLGARMIGRFDPFSYSALQALKTTDLPVLFLHGDADWIVPFSMSEENYAACASTVKELYRVPGAPHALAYYYDTEGYTKAVRRFLADCIKDGSAARMK